MVKGKGQDVDQYRSIGTRRSFERMTYERERACAGGIGQAETDEAPWAHQRGRACKGDGQDAQAMREQSGCIRIKGPRASIDDISPQELGEEGERIAAACLERMGYEIVRRNWHCFAGEADIVCRRDDEHVLVEVKTRLVTGRNRDPWPELAVDARKRERYRVMAELYLQELEVPATVRFDVIAVNVVGEGVAKVRYLEGAFECDR